MTGLALAIIGVLLIYSSGRLEYSASSVAGLYRKQILWIVITCLVCCVFFRVPLRHVAGISYPLYAFSIGLLLLVLALPSEGPHRWIRIGSVQVQPSELAKIATILALARYLGMKKRRLDRLTDFIVPILIAAFPAVLILVEPDLGTAAVFGPVLFAMLFWAGARPLALLFLISPLLSFAASSSTILFALFLVFLLVTIHMRKPFFSDSLAVVAMNLVVGLFNQSVWNGLKEYQKKRLLAFFGLESDPLGIDWQKIQSQVAIGSGGFWGKGYLEGTQKKLAFLPEQHTDFIFSIAGEETGFVGACIILLLFYFLLSKALDISRNAPQNHAGLIAMGVTSLLFTHVFVNITMVAGFLPVIGVPLPLLSYGGSSLLMFSLGITLLERVNLEKARMWTG
jgi:rod shape determining protein RodA